MEFACFAAGALFSIAQFLWGKRIFSFSTKTVRSALYIAQLLILSLALMVAMYLISETALLATAVGLVATFITLAVINSLKR